MPGSTTSAGPGTASATASGFGAIRSQGVRCKSFVQRPARPSGRWAGPAVHRQIPLALPLPAQAIPSSREKPATSAFGAGFFFATSAFGAGFFFVCLCLLFCTCACMLICCPLVCVCVCVCLLYVVLVSFSWQYYWVRLWSACCRWRRLWSACCRWGFWCFREANALEANDPAFASC